MDIVGKSPRRRGVGFGLPFLRRPLLPPRSAPPVSIFLARRRGFGLVRHDLPLVLVTGALLLIRPQAGFSQVSPAEILNPRLKAAEKAYLPRLVAFNRAIQSITFPFPFKLSRYVGFSPKEQAAADTRGLEFVMFHGQTVLKISGDYHAAFNAALLTQNQRDSRVFDDVVRPILHLLPREIPATVACDAVGLEISYHVRTANGGAEYEGVEDLVVVFGKADAFGFSNLTNKSEQQDVLNRSEIYVNGKEFGLALGGHDSIPLEALGKTPATGLAASASAPSTVSPDSDNRLAGIFQNVSPGSPPPVPRTTETPPSAPPNSGTSLVSGQPEAPAAPAAMASPDDSGRLQTKYQTQLDELSKEGVAKFHFVPYAPPSFVVFQNRIYLQLTLRNPQPFAARDASIYKRAAQTFDLFLAPQLQALLTKAPAGSDFDGLDISVLNELSSIPKPSSEAVEFICPLKPLRKFASAEITNQDLINESMVLVNGVRIALNLQQVE
jgi:hypothetical protein